LHSLSALHRDLKSGNIFLSLDGHVVLGDFGVAAQLIEGGEAATGKRTFAGTPCWMAPEVMMQQGSYASAADIWSFGITAIEMAKGKAPHAELLAMKVVMKVMSSQPPSLDDADDRVRFTKPFRAMIKRCLVKEPMERPTAVQLLKDPFFKKVKDAAYLQQALLSKLPPIWVRRAPKPAPAAAGAEKAVGRFGALAAMVDESTQLSKK
jgi:serine/threonine-protein kinase OSR1/STK39